MCFMRYMLCSRFAKLLFGAKSPGDAESIYPCVVSCHYIDVAVADIDTFFNRYAQIFGNEEDTIGRRLHQKLGALTVDKVEGVLTLLIQIYGNCSADRRMGKGFP